MGAFNWLNYGISHGYTTQSGCSDCPHYAVDIPTPFHTPITALFSGTVTSEKTGLPWGTEIFIKPDNGGPVYYYYHLDTLAVQANQHVNAGDVIGLSGGQNIGGSNPSNTANSSGPHTHVGFFSNFVSTAIGGRPFGPDITPYINAIRGQSGGTVLPPSTSGSTTPGSTSSSTPSDWQTQLHQEGIKIGLFLVAMVLVGFGLYTLFQKQVDGAIKKGIDTGKKVAEVAAV